MHLKVDPASLKSAGQEMQAITELVHEARALSSSRTLNGSFSSIDGLSGLAINHGSVLHGGAGSAVDCFGVFEKLLQWAHGNFAFNCQLFTGQDIANANTLAKVDAGGAVEAGQQVGSEARPAGTFGDFSFATPVASRPMSVDALVLELAATNNAQALEAAATWQALATQAAGIAASLRDVVGEVTAKNEGLWVPIAVGMISDFAANAEFFAVSAGEMSRSTGVLAGIAPAFLPAASQAQVALAAITEPVERRLAEEAFLTQFHSAFNAALPTAVPGIRNLMQESSGGSAQNSTVGLEYAGVKPASMPPVLGEVADMLTQATSQITGGAFDAVNQITAQLGGMHPHQVATQVASAIGPGGGFLPHSMPLGAVGTSMAQAAGAGVGVVDSMLRAGVVAGPVGGFGAHNAGAAHNGVTGVDFGGGSPSSNVSGGLGAMSPSSGSYADPRMGAAPPLNAPMTPISPTGSSSALPTGGSGGGAAAGRMGGIPMGGVPMGGANNQQQTKQRKPRHQIHKVQSLTAQYERDLNIRELLGEPPKVVPGIIGAWVRNPTQKPVG